MLVVVHIEPHGKEQRLEAGDDQKGGKQRACCCHWPDAETVYEEVEAKERPSWKQYQEGRPMNFPALGYRRSVHVPGAGRLYRVVDDLRESNDRVRHEASYLRCLL